MFTLRRWLSEQDLPQVKQFYATRFRANYPLIERSLFDWYFGPHKFICEDGRPSNSWSVITVWHNEEVIGHLGTIPVMVRSNGNMLRGVWHTNLYVAPEFEGKGIGSELIEAGLLGYDLMFGFDYTFQAERLYRRRQYQLPGSMTRYIRVMSAADSDQFLISAEASLHKMLIRAERIPVPSTFEELCVLPLSSSLDSGYDALWSRFSQQFGAETHRSVPFMQWRYFQNPSFTYTVLGAYDTEAELRGVLVYRIDEVSSHPGARVLRILELIADDMAIGSLLSTVDAIARSAEAAFIEYFCTSTAFEEFFKRAGYLPSQDPLVLKLSRLYHPIRPSSPKPIRFCFKFAGRRDTLSQQLSDTNQWYGTLGDSDLDRVQR